ncbi:hypothetical protein GOODEAATRI_024636 [Goodea atripinnis]|uniref:Uncharacterized protein n=1 Tax=Goodea atripinnis TaxID=208336 RepID=A0ABV0PGQ0_9TELE
MTSSKHREKLQQFSPKYACIVTNGTPGKLCNETQEVCWYLVISALCAGPQTAALHLWHIQPELSLRCGGFHTAAGIHRPPVSQLHRAGHDHATITCQPAQRLSSSLCIPAGDSQEREKLFLIPEAAALFLGESGAQAGAEQSRLVGMPEGEELLSSPFLLFFHPPPSLQLTASQTDCWEHLNFSG